MIPADHLLRRINGFATAVLADLHDQLKAFYSEIGRPSLRSRADDPDAPGRSCERAWSIQILRRSQFT